MINFYAQPNHNHSVSFGTTQLKVQPAEFKLDSKENSNKKKVATVSVLTSLACILGTLGTIAKIKKAKGAKDASMFNVHLRELDILALGVATVLGALIGGGLTDKKENFKAKLREASHQIIANIATPMVSILCLNTIGDKLNIKIPKVKSKSKLAKGFNVFTELLPNLVTSSLGLWSGINIGNKISNCTNDKIFGKAPVKREVKAADYCIHIDDPITVLTLADKSGRIKAITSKTMPFTFILSGYQAGVAHK